MPQSGHNQETFYEHTTLHVSMKETPDSEFRIFNFEKIWRYFPLTRPQKEILKFVLFSLFPFIFRSWAVYQNWKYARVFHVQRQDIGWVSSWKRWLFLPYSIPLTETRAPAPEQPVNQNTAVVIHVYYPHILKEILSLLRSGTNSSFHLYVTTPFSKEKDVREILGSSGFNYHLLTVENRGRDILPFLTILPDVLSAGHEIILKLHTKGENHVPYKSLWRNELYAQLIGPVTLNRNLSIMKNNPGIGILGPRGNILPMSLYYGANARRAQTVCSRMGVNDEQVRGLLFVAGSMFFIRREVLVPLMGAGLQPEEFEPERNQTDGTMAHAVERAISGGLLRCRLLLAETSFDADKPVCHVTTHHKFSF
jgi:hypothetical protein